VTKLLQDLRDELVRRDYAASTIRSYIQIVEAFRQLGLLLGSIGIFSKPSPSATRPPHRCEKPKGRRAALIEQ
jgi:hypothetical protein